MEQYAMKLCTNTSQNSQFLPVLALSLSGFCFSASGCGISLSQDATQIFGKDVKSARATGIEVDISEVLEDSDRERWIGASVTIPEQSKSGELVRSIPARIRFQETLADSTGRTLYLYEVTLQEGSLFVSTVTVASSESALKLPVTGTWERGEAGGYYISVVE